MPLDVYGRISAICLSRWHLKKKKLHFSRCYEPHTSFKGQNFILIYSRPFNIQIFQILIIVSNFFYCIPFFVNLLMVTFMWNKVKERNSFFFNFILFPLAKWEIICPIWIIGTNCCRRLVFFYFFNFQFVLLAQILYILFILNSSNLCIGTNIVLIFFYIYSSNLINWHK